MFVCRGQIFEAEGEIKFSPVYRHIVLLLRLCDEARRKAQVRLGGEARLEGEARLGDEARLGGDAWRGGEARISLEAMPCGVVLSPFRPLSSVSTVLPWQQRGMSIRLARLAELQARLLDHIGRRGSTVTASHPPVEENRGFLPGQQSRSQHGPLDVQSVPCTGLQAHPTLEAGSLARDDTLSVWVDAQGGSGAT